jgi:hypothetical protein
MDAVIRRSAAMRLSLCCGSGAIALFVKSLQSSDCATPVTVPEMGDPAG